jgi:Zn-dependent protease
MNDIDSIIRTITVYLIPVLFAIALHEAAHGYVARYFGDNTAERAGRLSLNPARHIDPFGTIALPLMLYFVGTVPFGYAKPVPVNYANLRNPKKQMAFVAIAGPAANLAMGLGWMIMLVLLDAASVDETFFLSMARVGVTVNAAMCVFNLIPIPPLDGGRVVTGLLPMPLAVKFARIENYGMYLFVALILAMNFHWLDGPLRVGMQVVVWLLDLLVTPLKLLLLN